MQPDNDKTRTHATLTGGTMVSHYRIIGKIGAGGMGEVYLAEDTKLNRQVALKFLPPECCRDEDIRTRFQREAQAAAKLSHPNIVTIHEINDYQGQPFFAMEHIEGMPLDVYVKEKKLSIDDVINLSVQIAEGLSEAHRCGITHRDIKPSNILVDKNGRPKILDFGLATIKGADKLTKTGSTLGTLHYMSPEQTRGEELDKRSDIFSLGVVLYEMLTGQLPFKGDHEPAIMYSIGYEEPEPLARYKSGVSNELQCVITKALAKRKDERYQHADELVADMKRLLSPGNPLGVMGARRMRIWAIPIALLILVVITFAFKPWQLLNKAPGGGATQNKRIVIVPFRNRTGDPSLDPLGKMVADWTTQSLSRTGMAEVVPPDIVLELDENKDIREIAAAAGVNTIIMGSYYEIGDSIQFQSQVMRADGNLLQAIDPVYAPRDQVMDGVELVRQRILGALMFVVDKRLEEWAGLISKPPNYEAYLQYMQGYELFDLKLDYAASIPYFAEAYALDTTFILPLIHESIACLNIGLYARTDTLTAFLEVRRTQLSPFQQLMLDENRAFLSGDLMGILAAARAEVKLASSSKWFYNLAWIALRVNHPKEAVEALKKVDLEQMEQIWVFYWSLLAEAYHLLGEHEKELETAREGRGRFPTSAAPYLAELYSLAALDRSTELQKLIEEQTTLREVGTPAGVRRLAAAELRAHGHEDQAMVMLDEAVRWYESQSLETMDTFRESYALTLYFARRWDKAGRVYEDLAKRNPQDSAASLRYETSLGIIAARQGNKARAMEVSNRLAELRLPYRFGADTYNRARIAAILGDKEQAIAMLKESFLQGNMFGIDMHKDFNFESLWDYPSFKELLKPKG